MVRETTILNNQILRTEYTIFHAPHDFPKGVLCPLIINRGATI